MSVSTNYKATGSEIAAVLKAAGDAEVFSRVSSIKTIERTDINPNFKKTVSTFCVDLKNDEKLTKLLSLLRDKKIYPVTNGETIADLKEFFNSFFKGKVNKEGLKYLETLNIEVGYSILSTTPDTGEVFTFNFTHSSIARRPSVDETYSFKKLTLNEKC